MMDVVMYGLLSSFMTSLLVVGLLAVASVSPEAALALESAGPSGSAVSRSTMSEGDVVVGEVVSAYPAQRELTILEEPSRQPRILKVINAEILQTLKKGDKVRVSSMDPGQAGAVFKA